MGFFSVVTEISDAVRGAFPAPCEYFPCVLGGYLGCQGPPRIGDPVAHAVAAWGVPEQSQPHHRPCTMWHRPMSPPNVSCTACQYLQPAATSPPTSHPQDPTAPEEPPLAQPSHPEQPAQTAAKGKTLMGRATHWIQKKVIADTTRASAAVAGSKSAQTSKIKKIVAGNAAKGGAYRGVTQYSSAMLPRTIPAASSVPRQARGTDGEQAHDLCVDSIVLEGGLFLEWRWWSMVLNPDQLEAPPCPCLWPIPCLCLPLRGLFVPGQNGCRTTTHTRGGGRGPNCMRRR